MPPLPAPDGKAERPILVPELEASRDSLWPCCNQTLSSVRQPITSDLVMLHLQVTHMHVHVHASDFRHLDN